MKSNLTGCVIEFSPNLKLKLKDQIGYGSFSFVYSTNDPRYVVKMINASDPKSLHSYNNEKFAFQNIKKHENIINCPAFKDNTSYKGITYCCLALENCPRGSIITMIVDKKMVFQETQVLQIFLDALLGVHQMHNTSPQPIAHRDLKGENILLGLDGRFKLTDFGSITIKKVFDITRENREAIQEDIDKSTTPTIRAPEQCDLYSGFPITEKVDVWALGCLLYILCFQKQPFETKLSTINCQYFMVDAHKYSKKLIELFPLFFVVDPKKRPNTAFILNHFEANFQSIPRTPFEAPAQLNTSTKPQKNTKQMEAQYVSSFGDFGKSGMPTEFMVDRRDSQGIKPSFKDAWHKKIKTITTKTQAWMLTAVEETEDGPTQRFIRYLIIKAWQKPHKIKKFYDVTQKKLMKSLENTIIILKALILLHNYTKKGPNDVYFQKSTPNVSYPKDLYRAILDTWKMIVESNKMSSRDKARSSYISNIIIEYTQVLSKKTDLLQHYFRIIEGSYSINPFLSHPGEENSPVNESVIRDLLDYLQSLIDFHKIILIHRNLWTIQCNLALSVLDEEFSLISLLTHLIVAFKKSSNYAPSKTNATATRENIQKLEEKFISCYQQLQKLFEHARKVDGFVDRSSMIPVLPNEVIKGVQSISILNPPKEQEFYAKEHLSTSKSIYSLKIPMSYGTFVKNINLEQIIYIEEDILETKPSVHEIPAMKKEMSQKVEREEIRQEPPQVVAKNPQVVQKKVIENEPPMQREERADFKADFDAFNKMQNFNNFDQQGFNVVQQGNMNQTDLFAGFNFNAMAQNNNVQQVPMQIPEEWISPEKPKQQVQEEPMTVPEANQEEIVELYEPEPATVQVQDAKPTQQVNIAQVPEEGSPMISLDNAMAEQEFKGIVIEPVEYNKEAEKQEADDNQAGSQQDLSQQDMLSSSRSRTRRPLGSVRNRRTQPKETKEIGEEENSQKAESIIAMSNRPNVRAALLTKDQARRQQKEANIPGQLNVNPLLNTDSVDTTLSLAKENMQNINMNYQTAPQQFMAAVPKNLEEIPDLIELPGADAEEIPEQIREESGFKGLAMGKKKESSAPTNQHAGDVGSEINNSPYSKSYGSSPERSIPNYSGPDQINMQSNLEQGRYEPNLNVYSKMSDDEKEESKVENNPQIPQGAIDFTFEALYASAGKKDKSQGLNNNQAETINSVPYNEWDNVFDVENNMDIQKINNLQQQQNQAIPIENFSFSGQEVTSHQLQKFIHQEVSKNIADWIIDYSQLKFKEQIGSGGSAQVYRGLWRGTEVAIKKMSLDNLLENRKKEFEREIAALMKLRPHQNLVNFMGVSLNGNELCIITEFCSGGTLFEWLHTKLYFPINWQQKIKMAMDVACGMNYLHTCNPPIIHRDLKSLNLLLDGPLESESQRFSVKLADFGLAKTEDQAQEMKTGLMGTFHWMAPEIFDNKVFTVKADVYSFGIVLYEIITRQTPYQELKTPIEIMRYVSIEKQRPDLSKVPFDCPKALVDIMIRCWAHEPQDRPDFAEILDKIKFLRL